MKARLISWRELAPETRHFDFEILDVERFGFVPGQFVSIIATLGEDEITRAYSIASPPDGNHFGLCLNRVAEGRISPYLFDMRRGDTVDIKGPYGAFHFRNPVRSSVLVATGTGVAPFRAMLQAVLPHDDTRQFKLIFGVRHEHGLLYREDFEELAARHANFIFVPTLTRPQSAWAGRTGRVQLHVLEAVRERQDVDVYICGLREMVDETRGMLKELGFERKRIIFEKYD